MALGWGLWEGPARFIFWDDFFAKMLGRLFSPRINNSAIGGIDFQKKWHKIRHGKTSVGSLAESGSRATVRCASPQSALLESCTLWHFFARRT